MSGRKQRKNARLDEEEEEPSSGSEMGSDAMDEDEEVMSHKNEEIQVDFEGRNPAGMDFHGIKQLLQQLFLKAHINLSQLTDMIIAQSHIGSVIIQSSADDEEMDDDDDDDMLEDNTIFGITTVINISHKKEIECIKQLRSHLLSRATSSGGDPKSIQTLKEILENPEHCVGILLNERFVNIPAQISVPLFDTLYKEIKDAGEKKSKYQFTHYLSVVKFHRLEAEGKKSAEDFYSNQEEEIICKDAVVSFEYSVKSEADMGLSGDWEEDDSGLTPYRKIILLEANKFACLTNTVRDFLSE